jgi:hypothetical protein
MKRVIEERINNIEIRSIFSDIPTINNFVTIHTLQYIRKTVQSVSNISLQKQSRQPFITLPGIPVANTALNEIMLLMQLKSSVLN